MIYKVILKMYEDEENIFTQENKIRGEDWDKIQKIIHAPYETAVVSAVQVKQYDSDGFPIKG
jgi:hypothetical protein